MKFQDLTQWDINLIKSHSIEILIGSNKIHNRYDALVTAVFSCITAKGFKIEPHPKVKGSSFLKEQISGFAYDRLDSNTPEELIELIFTLLNGKISKDETRTCTWNQPSDSWYSKTNEPKKPWII